MQIPNKALWIYVSCFLLLAGYNAWITVEFLSFRHEVQKFNLGFSEVSEEMSEEIKDLRVLFGEAVKISTLSDQDLWNALRRKGY